MTDLITEDWLRSAGFKWHQLDRQPSKHWLLWLGDVIDPGDPEQLGIELADDGNGSWFCWLRSDTAGRYHRFIHIRHLKTWDELVAMIQGLTGIHWNAQNNFYGVMCTEEQAQRIRDDHDRLDKWLMRSGHPWAPIEKDDSMGGALPEHLEAHEAARRSLLGGKV